MLRVVVNDVASACYEGVESGVEGLETDWSIYKDDRS